MRSPGSAISSELESELGGARERVRLGSLSLSAVGSGGGDEVAPARAWLARGAMVCTAGRGWGGELGLVWCSGCDGQVRRCHTEDERGRCMCYVGGHLAYHSAFSSARRLVSAIALCWAADSGG